MTYCRLIKCNRKNHCSSDLKNKHPNQQGRRMLFPFHNHENAALVSNLNGLATDVYTDTNKHVMDITRLLSFPALIIKSVWFGARASRKRPLRRPMKTSKGQLWLLHSRPVFPAHASHQIWVTIKWYKVEDSANLSNNTWSLWPLLFDYASVGGCHLICIH